MEQRHEAIVAAILGSGVAEWAVVAIGWGEMLIAVWILLGVRRREAAVFQIVLVMIMNALETWLARDLLLWGGYNMLWASLFSGLVFWNGFYLERRRHEAAHSD